MADEQEPSPEFLNGYNHGYIMAEHEPELLDKILKSLDGNPSNDYMRAMSKGQIQYELDQILAEAELRRDKSDHNYDLEP